MATLEDKILGEKIQNYCSSSEDEDENQSKIGSTQEGASQEITSSNKTHWTGSSSNTGPKGVINDWQLYKKLETEKREEAEKEKIALMKKLSITVKTKEEDVKTREQEELEKEFEDMLNDEFLLEFQKKRMAEMLASTGTLPMFGKLFDIPTSDYLLDAIDKENKNVTIVLHIFDDKILSCRTLNNCLQELAREYTNVKFCKISGSIAGMSVKFKQHGLPALLIYKNTQIIGNFIRITDELGDEFYPSDVESFLTENAMLPEKLQ